MGCIKIIFVYILKRDSKNTGNISYYTGITSDPARRFKEHIDGRTRANKGYNILHAKCIMEFNTRNGAIYAEKRIKRMSKKHRAMLMNEV